MTLKKTELDYLLRRLEQQQERYLKSVNDDSSMTLGDIIKIKKVGIF